MAVMMVITPAMAAKNDDKVVRSTPTICEGKASAENYVRALSDFELMRGMTNLLSDARMSNLRSAHDVHLWLQEQPDCAAWTERTYLIEIKWLYNEAVARGLTTTINKIGQGSLRWNPSLDRFEERVGERWVAWSTYHK